MNRKKITLLFILLILLILLYNYYPSSHVFNHSRINTKYDYKNYPKVNFLEFPLYYLIKPLMIEIKEGEVLFIPRRWWHWVFSSEGENIAINQWFPNMSKKKKPYKKRNPNFNSTIWKTEDLKKNINGYGTVIVSTNQNMYSFKRPGMPYKYSKTKVFNRITFSDYITNINIGKKFSGFFLDDKLSFSPKIKKQFFNQKILSHENCMCNIWYYSNGSNSGLHYDDYDNYLCQMKGTKKIYLFPPKYNKYLYGDQVLLSTLNLT